MKQLLRTSIAALSIIAVTGCASNLSGETYSREDARAQQRVEFGYVEYVRPVVIEGTDSKIGTATGAILGGIAGNTVGGGRGAAAATVAGAVVGGVVGSKTEEAATRAQGVEVTVKLDSGKIIAIVQQASPTETFNVGERVRLMTVNGNTRVAH